MISGPLLILVLPLAIAVVVSLLQRWPLLAMLVSIGTALLLGIAVIALPMDQSIVIFGGRQVTMGETVSLLGRELVLEQTDRIAMAFLFFTASGIFFLSWRFAPRTLIFPIGLGLLSLLCGALLIRPLIYAALLVEIAAALSVFTLQVEGSTPTHGGLRYLTFTTLALPGLLITHWLLERYAVVPDETELLTGASILLTVSFALWLGVVPFHTWVPALADQSQPLASAFVLTINNSVIWFLLFDFLETYPWLTGEPLFGPIASISGLLMVTAGGLLAPAQTRLGPMTGYAALVDGGAAMLALGLETQLGLTLVFLSLLVRPFGLLLLTAGISGLREHCDYSDDFDALQGLGAKAPWSTVALAVGALSMAGLPVSAGFIGRWALSRALMPDQPGMALLILGASAGVMIGAWRGLSSLAKGAIAPRDCSILSPSRSEGWLTATAVGVAAALCIGVGIYPRLIATVAANLAEAYSFFIP